MAGVVVVLPEDTAGDRQAQTVVLADLPFRLAGAASRPARMPGDARIARSVDPDRELARQLGAWDVAQKPLDLEAVQASLMRALRRAD